mmetsp:Transcript_16170/g.48904  ORF Transcript_16170/g.48904 Transcript_16170/m.48904 type:complete len:213 (+) Transcript_16170:337-975(+)
MARQGLRRRGDGRSGRATSRLHAARPGRRAPAAERAETALGGRRRPRSAHDLEHLSCLDRRVRQARRTRGHRPRHRVPRRSPALRLRHRRQGRGRLDAPVLHRPRPQLGHRAALAPAGRRSLDSRDLQLRRPQERDRRQARLPRPRHPPLQPRLGRLQARQTRPPTRKLPAHAPLGHRAKEATGRSQGTSSTSRRRRARRGHRHVGRALSFI